MSKLDPNFAKVLNSLDEIYSQLKLTSFIQPKGKNGRSIVAEKKEFFDNYKKGKLIEPVFTYDREIDLDLNGLKEKKDQLMLWAMSMDFDPILMKMLKRNLYSIELFLLMLTAFKEGDERGFFYNSLLYYGNISLEDFEAAKNVVLTEVRVQVDSDGDRKMDAKAIKKYFERVIKAYEFEDDVEIVMSDEVRSVSILGKKVVIPTCRNVSRLKLVKLISHELETHLLRRMNHEALNLGPTLPQYYPTEEGLAIYNQSMLEKKIVGNFNFPLRIVLYFLGADKIIQGSNFGETFDFLFKYLMHYFDEDKAKNFAWGSCMRLFRGFTRFDEGFYFPKDLSYFRGYQQIEDFIKKDDFEKLYLGKIGVLDVSIMFEVLGFTKNDIKYKPLNMAYKIWEELS